MEKVELSEASVNCGQVDAKSDVQGVAGIQHRIRISKLANDLLGVVSFPTFRHRRSPCLSVWKPS